MYAWRITPAVCTDICRFDCEQTATKTENMNVKSWSLEDVSQWLSDSGFESDVQAFLGM